MDFIKDDDALILYKRYDNMMNNLYYGLVEHTKFLTPYEKKMVISLANKYKLYYQVFESHINSERDAVYFSTDPFELEAYIYQDFAAVQIRKVNDKMDHKNVLGALMGLGIERETVGDIVFGDDNIEISVTSEMADYIVFNLDSIGRNRVKPSLKDDVFLEEVKLEYKTSQIIVSSLRLDVVVAGLINLSRSNSKKMIQMERIKVNHQVESNPSVELDTKDTISIHKHGRFIIGNILGRTRKDKIRLEIKEVK